jgi:hypothetical protein
MLVRAEDVHGAHRISLLTLSSRSGFDDCPRWGEASRRSRGSEQPMSKRSTKFQQAFAVVRADLFQGDDVKLENKVTVKEVVWSQARSR